MSWIDRAKSVAMASIALVILSSCGSDSDGDQAKLRVMHASPNASRLDLTVDGQSFVSGLAYRAVANYSSLEEGIRTIRFVDPVTNIPLAAAENDFRKGINYTAYASGNLRSLRALVFQDSTTFPGSANVSIRIIHLSPTALGLDIYVTEPGAPLGMETPLFTSVAFQTASEYDTVGRGQQQIRATLARTKSVVIDSGTVDLLGGTVQTIVALDAAGGGGPFSFQFLRDR